MKQICIDILLCRLHLSSGKTIAIISTYKQCLMKLLSLIKEFFFVCPCQKIWNNFRKNKISTTKYPFNFSISSVIHVCIFFSFFNFKILFNFFFHHYNYFYYFRVEFIELNIAYILRSFWCELNKSNTICLD